jgi:hypothetical protein
VKVVAAVVAAVVTAVVAVVVASMALPRRHPYVATTPLTRAALRR